MDKIVFWELTPHEKNVLMPLVVQILQHRETKEKVFSNTKIRNVLKEFGEDITDAQIRKLIFNIRNNDVIDLLIANQDGYFVANNINDIGAWIDRHKGKIASMQQTLKSIENQFDRKKDSLIKGESSSLIGQLSIFDLGLD
jgi:hypothetical protein